MKKCLNCGREYPDGVEFCDNCGSRLSDVDARGGAYYNRSSDGASQNKSQGSFGEGFDRRRYVSMYINPRNVALCIVLSIVTCGIYGIYWMIMVNDEINGLVDDSGATSGGVVVVLNIITCGIYGIYWAYKMGERNDKIKDAGVGASSHILFLVLAIFGLNIVNLAILQDTINKCADGMYCESGNNGREVGL